MDNINTRYEHSTERYFDLRLFIPAPESTNLAMCAKKSDYVIRINVAGSDTFFCDFLKISIKNLLCSLILFFKSCAVWRRLTRKSSCQNRSPPRSSFVHSRPCQEQFIFKWMLSLLIFVAQHWLLDSVLRNIESLYELISQSVWCAWFDPQKKSSCTMESWQHTESLQERMWSCHSNQGMVPHTTCAILSVFSNFSTLDGASKPCQCLMQHLIHPPNHLTLNYFIFKSSAHISSKQVTILFRHWRWFRRRPSYLRRWRGFGNLSCGWRSK